MAERTTSHTQAAGSGAAPGGGVVYYLAADHLGSTSLALTTSGVVTGTRAYYMPYGAERGPAASLPTDFTYTGGRGTSFGLVHLGARWYDSSLNRWTQPDSIIPDPVNPQSHNRYSYVDNRPLVSTDPSGHCDYQVDETGASTGEEDHSTADDAYCWGLYHYLIGKGNRDQLGFAANGLDGWSSGLLRSLMQWLQDGVVFGGPQSDWNANAMRVVVDSLNMVLQGYGGDRGVARYNLGIRLPSDTLTFDWVDTIPAPGGGHGAAGTNPRRRHISLAKDIAGSGLVLDHGKILHELGHVVDFWRFPEVGSWAVAHQYPGLSPGEIAPGSIPRWGDHRGESEMWANAFAVYLMVNYADFSLDGSTEWNPNYHEVYRGPLESYFGDYAP